MLCRCTHILSFEHSRKPLNLIIIPYCTFIAILQQESTKYYTKGIKILVLQLFDTMQSCFFSLNLKYVEIV